MTRIADDDRKKPTTETELILWFLSGGIVVFPVMLLILVFWRPLAKVLDANEWWFYGIVLCGSGVVLIGMHLLERTSNKVRWAVVGAGCWVALYFVAWEFSSRGFKF